jgi:hypothetical protein
VSLNFQMERVDDSFLRNAPLIQRSSMECPVPAERVWGELTGPGSLAWCTIFHKARWTSERPYRVGTTRVAHVFWGLMHIDERYIVWEEGRRKTFIGLDNSLPFFKRLCEEYVVEPLDDGRCRFTWTIAAELTTVARPLGPIMPWLLGTLFKDCSKHFGGAVEVPISVAPPAGAPSVISENFPGRVSA